MLRELYSPLDKLLPTDYVSAGQATAEADAEVAYARVAALCEAIKAELNNDLKIHEQNILPQFINLPQVTAGEYCRVSLLLIKVPGYSYVCVPKEHMQYFECILENLKAWSIRRNMGPSAWVF